MLTYNIIKHTCYYGTDNLSEPCTILFIDCNVWNVWNSCIHTSPRSDIVSWRRLIRRWPKGIWIIVLRSFLS